MWLSEIAGKLFGSSKVIEKMGDGIYNGLDKAVYTPEEQIDNRLKSLAAYEPFKIAQRLLALVFTIPYALAWMITFIASFFIDVADQQAVLLNGNMGQIVLAIVGFYFLGGVVNGVKR